MLRKVKTILNNQKGITGLETAIILIAFVVVAAIFAYAVLSVGLFSTQKSQEAVYAGLQEARSTIELKGAVIGKAENVGASGYISQLTFTVSNALGGEPIDFTAPTAGAATGLAASGSNNLVVISYMDSDQRIDDVYWTLTKMGSADSDYLLEEGEKFQITIGSDVAGAGGGNLVNALPSHLTVNKQYTIEVKSPRGAVLTFERVTPAFINSVENFN